MLGIALKPYFAALHQQPAVVAGVLAGTAVLIFGAERWGRRDRPLASLSALDAVLIGAFQASALVPGVSRSAATMCGALLRGLRRPDAARFSFLLSVPVLAGAGVLAAADLVATPNVSALLLPLLLGTFTSMLVGLASIYWLLSYLQRRSLLVFGWYRIAAGLLALAVLLLRA